MTVEIQRELRVGGNVTIHGKLEKISFNGLLLRCDTTLPEQTPCLVFLHLDEQGMPSMETQG